MNGWRGRVIAVDWGTTNRRAYLLDPAGAVLDHMEDDLGVASVPPGGFEPALAAISQRLGEAPMLLAGMVGSNRGWHEAPYVRCPAGFAELAGNLLRIADDRVIVPGLSWVEGRCGDVMRGEEVQIFGLLSRATQPGALTICHPGTHTKWVRVEDGRVTRFRTAMTGELFSLLCKHSILAPLLKIDRVDTGSAFAEGVREGFGKGTLTADLFSIRAKVLLSLLAEADASSLASGLLIGCDLRAGIPEHTGGEIVVLGHPRLTRLYASALRQCGHESREVDGAMTFIAGMQAIRRTIA